MSNSTRLLAAVTAACGALLLATGQVLGGQVTALAGWTTDERSALAEHLSGDSNRVCPPNTTTPSCRAAINIEAGCSTNISYCNNCPSGVKCASGDCTLQSQVQLNGKFCVWAGDMTCDFTEVDCGHMAQGDCNYTQVSTHPTSLCPPPGNLVECSPGTCASNGQSVVCKPKQCN
jgi:hypothetical protein